MGVLEYLGNPGLARGLTLIPCRHTCPILNCPPCAHAQKEEVCTPRVCAIKQFIAELSRRRGATWHLVRRATPKNQQSRISNPRCALSAPPVTFTQKAGRPRAAWQIVRQTTRQQTVVQRARELLIVSCPLKIEAPQTPLARDRKFFKRACRTDAGRRRLQVQLMQSMRRDSDSSDDEEGSATHTAAPPEVTEGEHWTDTYTASSLERTPFAAGSFRGVQWGRSTVICFVLWSCRLHYHFKKQNCTVMN